MYFVILSGAKDLRIFFKKIGRFSRRPSTSSEFLRMTEKKKIRGYQSDQRTK